MMFTFTHDSGISVLRIDGEAIPFFAGGYRSFSLYPELVLEAKLQKKLHLNRQRFYGIRIHLLKESCQAACSEALDLMTITIGQQWRRRTVSDTVRGFTLLTAHPVIHLA